MNDYIINPWFFYWASFANKAIFSIGALAALFGVISILIWLSYAEESKRYKPNPDEVQKRKTAGYIMSVACVVCCMLLVIIPNKQTLIQMVIAEKVTYSNVEKVSKKIEQTSKSLVDYIITKSKEFNK